ncbi:MAG: anion permease [Methanosarcinales archaeon]|nr:anion permease [Methanosarcinales archaeon]
MAIAAFGVAIFMGLNIGGNNAAASMGAAYGANVRTKKQAIILIGIFSLLGAIFSGGEVIKTFDEGLLLEYNATVLEATIAIGVAAFCIFLANMARVPVSTSQAAVGSAAGIGVFYASLNMPKLLEIIGWWIFTPILAFVLSYIVGKYLHTPLLLWMVERKSEEEIHKIMAVFLTVSGCYVAYTAGANNAANATGLLVNTGLMTPMTGAIVGGITIGLGALLMGGRVLETVGHEITELCVIRAAFVEVIAAVIVHAASYMGIPVSLGEIVTASIIGIGCARQGVMIAKNNTVKNILIAWVLSPLVAGSFTYAGIWILTKFV